MNVVIAIDSFKGSLTSMEAGKSAADGIKRVFPNAEIAVCPLADGGEGTVEPSPPDAAEYSPRLPLPARFGNRSPAATASSKKAKPRSSKCPVPPGSR